MDTKTNDHDALAEKLATAIGMQQMGIAMMRQSLTRRHPDESAAEIDARLTELLLHRPGAELGDGVGVVGAWPRHRR